MKMKIKMIIEMKNNVNKDVTWFGYHRGSVLFASFVTIAEIVIIINIIIIIVIIIILF